MTGARPHLDAIKAAPDDDAPKLVWADWLDERGEDRRAGFIRAMLAYPRREVRVEEVVQGGQNRYRYLVFGQDGDGAERIVADVFRRMPLELYAGALWEKVDVQEVGPTLWVVTVRYAAPVFRDDGGEG